MMHDLFSLAPDQRVRIQPRDYQIKDHDHSFMLWDRGEHGTLTRSATGTGKTAMACLKFDTWLQRGDDHRCMVISYERQLVGQFAQEIEDFLGIRPGIEMADETIDADYLPKICVISRASLLRATPPTQEQLAHLAAKGILAVGACPERAVSKMLKFLEKGGDPEIVRDEIKRLNARPEAHGESWSRVYKFDWRLHWLLCFDEAHRHAYHLTSISHIVDWFEQNPKSRRFGLTATPKRGDQVSIGHKMFPAVSLDYPFYSPSKPCAVKDGYAVPYVQKYIEVAGVDFKSLAKIGADFDEADLERRLGEEKTLAGLCIPLLENVGGRQTLIFSPGVDMARNVARFINARAEVRCKVCNKIQWHPKALIGDGTACSCGALIESEWVTRDSNQARELDGSSPDAERRQVYEDHQAGKFQFLSVCGLCREGYNDPNVACVAVFRPVSRRASSLAEQMKGRACRPLRGLIDRLQTKEERLGAIAASAKPNALIIDLVGITGLADCATTAQIYAESLADEIEVEEHEDADQIAEAIIARAEELMVERGRDGEIGVEDAIEQAKAERKEERDAVRREREERERRIQEEARKRAKAGAQVDYTSHDVGHGEQLDPSQATPGQYKLCARLGMEIKPLRSKKQIGRVISLLKQRLPLEEIAFKNGLDQSQWERRGPTLNTINFMRWKGVPTERARTQHDASLLIDAKLHPDKFSDGLLASINKARTSDDLTGVAKDLALVRGVLDEELYEWLVQAGQSKRANHTVHEHDYDEDIPL
jgi:superfamily II DNA or RNA helicase